MSLTEDFAPAAQGDLEAAGRLKSYLGPFVHCALLAQVSTRAATGAVPALLAHALQQLSPASVQAHWVGELLEAARSEAERLAHNPLNTVEQADESVAGTEARRLLTLLRPMTRRARELALLRLVEGIGTAEIVAVCAETAGPEGARVLESVLQALALLSPGVEISAADPYLTEPQASTPLAAVVAVENKLELLRYNEDLPVLPLPGVAPAQSEGVDPQIATQVVQGATDGPMPQLMKVGGEREITVTQPAALQAGLSPVTAPHPALLEVTASDSTQLNPALHVGVAALPAHSWAPVPLPPSTRGPPPSAAPSTDWRTGVTRLLEPVRLAFPLERVRFPSFAVALVLGLLASATGYGALTLVERGGKGTRPMTAVLVAGKELQAGSHLDRTCLAERWIPTELAGSYAVKPESIDGMKGQQLRYPMQAGDPLLWTHFSAANSEHLASRLAHHIRAVTLPITRLSSNAGLLRPEDHVDVLLYLAASPGKGGPLAMTMFENVPVLAVGLVSSRTVIFPQGRDAEYSNISVGVLAEEAELLALADSNSAIRLSLRNPEDHESSEKHSPVLLRQLLDHEKGQDLQRRRMRTIQVIRNSRPVTR